MGQTEDVAELISYSASGAAGIRSTPGQGSNFTCGFGRERLLAPETHDSHAAE